MSGARRLACVAIVVLMAACSDSAPDSSTGPSAVRPALANLRLALAVQRRHTDALLQTPGVVGTAITGLPDGRAGVLVLAQRAGISGLPQTLDGVPLTVRVTGLIMAFSDPTRRQRPAPSGFSVGHPAITAGTIGARVRDALGRVYILSNNHVLANSNGATNGDPIYQPGPFDGGTAADQIATLTDFQTITFGPSGGNTMDAAVALSSTDLLDNAVPSDDGYGMPNSRIFGDSDGDGMFDDRSALLDLPVQKYGRTTRLTRGTITGVNATVTVCYAVSGFTCTKSARFVDQLIIGPAGFSNGGDSGSLIVSDDANLNPVGLLFAGSSSVTIANRIDLVLDRFGVTIDGFAPPPPGPFTDVGVMTISGPASVVQNHTGSIAVTVRNVGNQDVNAFDVTLEDTTEHVTVGTQSLAGLVAGAGTTLTFAWTPTSAGDHALVASHTLSDERATNDRRSATIPVLPPLIDIGVTNTSISGQLIEGHVVSVAVTVANAGNQNVSGSFDVTLEDATAGVSIGTQSVAGIATGASATRTFTWDLTGATSGDHTLVAIQSFSDDNADNDRRTTIVTVNPKPTDVALTNITGPARVTVGEVAHVVVTVQNVGETDVSASFAVELVDATAGGVFIGAGTVAGLALGASTTVNIPWNTSGAATGGHTLMATQKLPDKVVTNNSIAIPITVQPPPDIAVTTLTAPGAVAQGGTASIDVTVQNVGGQHVGGFDIILTDATAGVTIGTQAIPGLAMGFSTTRTFTWNTTNTAPGGHTLVATQTLTDGNPANDQASTSVTVSPPTFDVALTTVSAPATVTRGSTPTIGVTIQNMGGQNVSGSITVVLTDATAGVTIGTQTVSGLAGGASATRNFSWSTATAALGAHSLVASHSLADADGSNNQRATTVNVVSAPADLALASLTAPGQVTIGDTVPVAVTVQNVGGQDVVSNFDVVLTDGGVGGVVIGVQTIPGLPLGASATRTFTWNTGGVSTGGHTLVATQKYADGNSSNNARAIIVTVNPPSMHVGNLGGVVGINADSWTATVQITAHDVRHNALNGVTVRGLWNGTSPEVQCVTSDAESTPGTCTVVLSSIPKTTRQVTFSVTGLTLPGSVYKSAANHDPDGSSNGFSITLRQF